MDKERRQCPEDAHKSLGPRVSDAISSGLLLNHISFVTADVQRSTAFYSEVLGFNVVSRPNSFEFDGCWYVQASPCLLKDSCRSAVSPPDRWLLEGNSCAGSYVCGSMAAAVRLALHTVYLTIR